MPASSVVTRYLPPVLALVVSLSAYVAAPSSARAEHPVSTTVSGWHGSALSVTAGEVAHFRVAVRTGGRRVARSVRMQVRPADGGAWDSTAWRRTSPSGRLKLSWTAPRAGAAMSVRLQVRREGAATTAVTAPRQVVVSDPAPESFAQEVLRLTNEARAQARTCGGPLLPAAPPLTSDPRLDAAASAHAEDMVVHDYFSHDSLDGRSAGDRITAAGYRWRAYAENIAAGQPSPTAVVAGWIESPGHCQNLMNPTYKQLGVGFSSSAAASYGTYWVQDFGARL